MNPSSLFQIPRFATRVLPVIVITHVHQAVPLAHALLEGGIDAMEITLRHAAGLPAIEAVAREVPEMVVGAGTVTQASELTQVRNAGAKFALSPGMTPALITAAKQTGLPFIPGVMTPGEIMLAREAGFQLAKLFPAAQSGGLGMLKALQGPLGDMRFCPTGGITADQLPQYLSQPNVAMVGGSWLTPAEQVSNQDWTSIAQLAREATRLAQSVNHP
jgi:2-dehydro-3-deoxyphosphogluconate aldolase/(4S)-4-hydroxy-2-oxoglutarate aldolase